MFRILTAFCLFGLSLTGCAIEASPTPDEATQQGLAATAQTATDLAKGICIDNCMKGPKVGNESFADKADRCSEKCDPKKEAAPLDVLGEAEVMACAGWAGSPG